ncbi:hypothetical protein IJG14_00165 [bacterium]|nr:hypothetical protein [bacterium]
MKNKNDKNINVIKFSLKNVYSKKSEQKIKLKNFNGFVYIKEEKDLNGNPFVKENLLEYAGKCRYTVRIMREIDGKVFLYNYFVYQTELAVFLNKIENGTFDGKIIEIENYIPEDLA